MRQLIGRLGGGRGHRTFAGTPEQVADAIEEWFDQRRRRRLQHHAAGAAVRAWRPSSTTSCRSCSERGLFRTEYTGTTLRDHYGLPRPANQYARQPATAAA